MRLGMLRLVSKYGKYIFLPIFKLRLSTCHELRNRVKGIWERGPLLVLIIISYIIVFALLKSASVPLRSTQKWITVPDLWKKVRPKQLSDILQSVDHLNAVKLERDGDLNKNFRKEIVIGDNITNQHARDGKTVLVKVFKKADEDKDGRLSVEEMTEWISKKIKEHLNQALQENFILFTAIDNKPRDGVITWDEYYMFFLKQNGVNVTQLKNHTNYRGELKRSAKESLMRDKAAWSEAARSDPDCLNIDEFLSFRHPESSHSTILTMVQELIDKFDLDGDEILTEEEFCNTDVLDENQLNDEDQEDKIREEKMKFAVQERKKEFQTMIDVNHDGQVNRKELLMYIDPRNPRHAKEETETLFALADTDQDNFLSISEVLNKMELFLGSKMVDTGRSFHDEF